MARFDLTDEQWAKLQPLMPPERFGHRGHPYCDHRTVINGILWIIRTGSPWRDLPERYGSWKTCYDRLRRWTNNGLWQRILQCVQANQPDENNVEWHVCVLDSTSIKAHPHAAGAPRKKTTKRGKARRTNRPTTKQPTTKRPTKRSDAAGAV